MKLKPIILRIAVATTVLAAFACNSPDPGAVIYAERPGGNEGTGNESTTSTPPATPPPPGPALDAGDAGDARDGK